MTQTQIRRRTFQYRLYIFHDWWPVMSSPVTHSTTTRPDDDKLLINLPRTSNLFQIYKCDRWPGTHRVHTGATDWVFRRHLIRPPSRLPLRVQLRATHRFHHPGSMLTSEPRDEVSEDVLGTGRRRDGCWLHIKIWISIRTITAQMDHVDPLLLPLFRIYSNFMFWVESCITNSSTPTLLRIFLLKHFHGRSLFISFSLLNTSLLNSALMLPIGEAFFGLFWFWSQRAADWGRWHALISADNVLWQ